MARVLVLTAGWLVDGPGGGLVRESTLPTEPGGKFDYRYRSLRLLIQAGGRLFRVPEHWTAQGRTLIVPYDAVVRLHVIPRPGA